jgi:hypothetical protein
VTTLELLIEDLVAANRILAHEGVVDAYGHVSARHPAQRRLNAIGFEPLGAGAKALDDFQRAEAAKWKDIAHETGFAMPR